MNGFKYIIQISLLMFVIFSSQAETINLSTLEEAMFRTNPDLAILRLKENFSDERIVQAKSGFYPRLSSSWVVNEGKEGDPVSDSSIASSSSSINPSIPGASASSSVGGSQSVSQDGWSGDLTLSIPVFNRFLNKTALDNSKINNTKDQISLTEGIQNKKGQLIQLIMELNGLTSIRKTIFKAQKLSGEMKKNSGQDNVALYSKDKKLKQDEFFAELEYQFQKTELAWGVATQAFFDLIPEADMTWIKKLPKFQVEFDAGSIEALRDKFADRSLSLKKLALDVQSYKNIYEQSKWEKSWIPQLYITGAFSKSRDWAGTLNDEESWRVSALLTFNIFDGFYTSSRKAQAHLSYRMIRELQKSGKSKYFINLERLYRQGQMANARHKFMMAKVNRTKRKLRNLETVASSGTGMKNEISSVLLELSKLEWEGKDELKKYQQYLISLAQETNQMDKLRIINE